MDFTGPRYLYAKLIAETIINYLNGLDPDLKIKFLKLLSYYNLTAIFEILNPNTQHVEDLSYLKEYINLFC